MYDDDDEFLRGIPPFLRRCQEPPPRKLPTRPRDLPTARSQAAESRSRPAAAPTAAAPTPAASKPAASAPAVPKMIEIAPQPSAAEGPVVQRTRLALAFENQDMAEGQDGEDITFQVSLPRGVARQICTLAVERDTTQRAVVLRALRLAGLSVPEGSDIDRRAKRQA